MNTDKIVVESRRVERDEPKIQTVLRSMISAIDTGDDITYWKCAELLNKLHLEACSYIEKLGDHQTLCHLNRSLKAGRQSRQNVNARALAIHWIDWLECRGKTLQARDASP